MKTNSKWIGLIILIIQVFVQGVSRRLHILRVLKSLLSHDDLVYLQYLMLIRSLIEYSSPVFLGCGECLNNKLLRICKRAFGVIHGDGISCRHCYMFDLIHRREESTLSIFVSSSPRTHFTSTYSLPVWPQLACDFTFW